ncbi:hypothetical protein [Longimicrobium sp.]|uniref:hypothetical protein n=1 Tax=Longimicrobium sp. TaxID=2029185 RepID=UPI002BEF4EDA|nr:hypothetical protein [Longimicrobium sp.]HSU17620.1 hypothetical protein [Longimicrobium sp.]
MQPYSLVLHGFENRDGGLPGALVRDLLDAVDDGAKGAVRLRFEGRSRAKGGFAPGWVNDAATFQVVGLLPENAGIELSAPTFLETLPERFAQGDLFRVVNPDDTALTLLGCSLGEAVRGEADSDAFDEPLLATFEEFRRVFRHGVQSLEIRNGRPGSTPLVVTRQGIQTVHRLKSSTPRPRRVRLAGKLDAIRHSDRAFTLVIESGAQIRGVLIEGEPEDLAGHFGRTTIVSGTAQFRPSGTLLRVEADHLERGTDKDLARWSAVPAPLDPQPENRRSWQPQHRNGLASIVGAWPGDEGDEEFFRMLEERA